MTMEAKKTGISRDLLPHPGATIADMLKERELTQSELAARTGVSTTYVCNVIAGKKIYPLNSQWPWNMRWGCRNPSG